MWEKNGLHILNLFRAMELVIKMWLAVFRPAQLHFLSDMDDMQIYVGRRISSAYKPCCIFPSFRVSRLLSHPFKALLVLHPRLLPYKAAALCSQSPTWNTGGWMRHKLSIIVSQEEAVRTVPLKPFYRRHISACLFLFLSMHPSFPPFSFPSLSSASQLVMWLTAIHAVH